MTALLIIFVTAVFVMFAGLFIKRDSLQPLTLLGVAGALAVSLLDLNNGGGLWSNTWVNMFQFDLYATTFSSVVLIATLFIIGLSRYGFRQLEQTLGDNYALILFSLCGALVMFSFTNLVMLFLGIEILSIPLYVLAGSRRDDLASNEAALKYFLMGAFATGILLFGMTLIYGATGTFDTGIIAVKIGEGVASMGMLKVGILLMVIGLSFKVSAAPFHFWAPDVYQGSPNLVTLFMATVVKTAGFAAFYRLFSTSFHELSEFWTVGMAAIAGLTMTVANVTAIFQQDFKRMMAYSSISHAGYLLLAIIGFATPGSSGAILLYTLTYSLATICAFAVYMLVSEQNGDGSFTAFNGLSKKQPFAAFIMTVAMLSLAGIPPLAGFFGKYFVFTTVIEQYPWLVVLAVVNSAISIYYYFRVVIAMYFAKETSAYEIMTPASVRWVMIIATALIAVLALAPGHVYGLIR